VGGANHSTEALRELVTAAHAELSRATEHAQTCTRLATDRRNPAQATHAWEVLIRANHALQDAAIAYRIAVDDYLAHIEGQNQPPA